MRRHQTPQIEVEEGLGIHIHEGHTLKIKCLSIKKTSTKVNTLERRKILNGNPLVTAKRIVTKTNR